MDDNSSQRRQCNGTGHICQSNQKEHVSKKEMILFINWVQFNCVWVTCPNNQWNWRMGTQPKEKSHYEPWQVWIEADKCERQGLWVYQNGISHWCVNCFDTPPLSVMTLPVILCVPVLAWLGPAWLQTSRERIGLMACDCCLVRGLQSSYNYPMIAW